MRFFINYKTNFTYFKMKNFAFIATISTSYGGRNTLRGSYLLERDDNEIQKAVNSPNNNSSDDKMAMAQTMEKSMDEKKD